MSNYDGLKRYLEVMTGPALVDSAEILELIEENERLSSENKQRELCEAKLIAGGDSLNREADNLLARLLAVIAERDAALAELEALRQEKTDWQKECLKKGFEYVRESDDHYVVADPAEMVSLLRDLLGIDVRQKDGSDYGVSVAQLEEQIEGLVNTIHGLEACRKDAERYRLLRENEDFFIRYTDGNDIHLIESPERLDEVLDAAGFVEVIGHA